MPADGGNGDDGVVMIRGSCAVGAASRAEFAFFAVLYHTGC